jgi:hypothetical protein
MKSTRLTTIPFLTEKQYKELVNTGSVLVNGELMKKEDYQIFIVPDTGESSGGGSFLYRHKIVITFDVDANTAYSYAFECVNSDANSYAVSNRVLADYNEFLNLVKNIPVGYYSASRCYKRKSGNWTTSTQALGVMALLRPHDLITPTDSNPGIKFYGMEQSGNNIVDLQYNSTSAFANATITIEDTITIL